ncbi:hypothetical protein GOP47_0029148 [Adiantum capillus-veneris]|nr:hypothetical protein GOP47_0029148 [Adiantum capillus-veneris]
MSAASDRATKTMAVLWLLHCSFMWMLFLQCEGHYLKASSRWLVRESDGERVKLACVNWAGHLETMLPEGLNRQPLYKLALGVKGMGFNCVRLTFATYMFTNATLSNWTVTESFTHANLQHSLKGIAIHNPELVKLPIQVAYARVVNRLTRVGLLVILDNHVSTPQWCCSNNDGNGFWGDTFFDPNSWLQGLSLAASLFKGNSEVVGLSLRNELRGPKQNIQGWYKYMSLGAKAVNEANPELLIILSGLHFATDLRFLPKNHLASLPFEDKLVYEMHWHTASYGINFAKGNLNKVCAIATSSIIQCGAFMVTPSSNGSFISPLFVSEFGIDQRGAEKGDNRFINCFLAFMASMDLDWAYWPLQGNYYVRSGHEGDEEFYGILNSQWSAPRNISLLARLQVIQQSWQSSAKNSSSENEYQVLFHPSTGMCVQKGSGNKLLLGSCMGDKTFWRYTAQGRLEVVNSYFCVASEGEGQFAKLVPSGTEKNGPWTLASVAKLQFSTIINSTHHSLANSQYNTSGYPFKKSNDTSKGPYQPNYRRYLYGRNIYNHSSSLPDDTIDWDVNFSEALIDGVTLNVVNENGNENMQVAKEESLAKPKPIHPNPLLCLDGSTPPSITTKRCVCVQEDEMDCSQDDDPSPQWFVLISSSKTLSTMYSSSGLGIHKKTITT